MKRKQVKSKTTLWVRSKGDIENHLMFFKLKGFNVVHEGLKPDEEHGNILKHKIVATKNAPHHKEQ